MREEFVDPIARDDADLRADGDLRPRRIGDFVGQEELKKHLAIVLEAARQRNEAADH
ncbi:MAG: Holliday junction branch migration DNA helicase RuvB, partial [Actinomycetota bacterium]